MASRPIGVNTSMLSQRQTLPRKHSGRGEQAPGEAADEDSGRGLSEGPHGQRGCEQRAQAPGQAPSEGPPAYPTPPKASASLRTRRGADGQMPPGRQQGGRAQVTSSPPGGRHPPPLAGCCLSAKVPTRCRGCSRLDHVAQRTRSQGLTFSWRDKQVRERG